MDDPFTSAVREINARRDRALLDEVAIPAARLQALGNAVSQPRERSAIRSRLAGWRTALGEYIACANAFIGSGLGLRPAGACVLIGITSLVLHSLLAPRQQAPPTAAADQRAEEHASLPEHFDREFGSTLDLQRVAFRDSGFGLRINAAELTHLQVDAFADLRLARFPFDSGVLLDAEIAATP